jgi:hypothetical protein
MVQTHTNSPNMLFKQSMVLNKQGNFATRLAVILAAHSEINPFYLKLEKLKTSVLNDINQVLETL